MQEMLDTVHGYGVDFCVKFNNDKSQIMIINDNKIEEKEWKPGDNVLKKTRECMYLGVKLTENGSERIKDEKLFQAN